MKKVERKRIAANIINDGSSTDQLSTEGIKITTRKERRFHVIAVNVMEN